MSIRTMAATAAGVAAVCAAAHQPIPEEWTAGAPDPECPLNQRVLQLGYDPEGGVDWYDESYVRFWDYRKPGSNAYQLGRTRPVTLARRTGLSSDYPPVPGTEREFRSGRARIVVQIEDTHQWDTAQLHRRVGMGLAGLPAVLIQRLPFIDLYVYDYGGNAHADYAGQAVHMPWYYVHVDDAGNAFPRQDRYAHFNRVLVHEFAHMLDYHSADRARRAGTDLPRWSESPEWRDAVEQSPC